MLLCVSVVVILFGSFVCCEVILVGFGSVDLKFLGSLFDVVSILVLVVFGVDGNFILEIFNKIG